MGVRAQRALSAVGVAYGHVRPFQLMFEPSRLSPLFPEDPLHVGGGLLGLVEPRGQHL